MDWRREEEEEGREKGNNGVTIPCYYGAMEDSGLALYPDRIAVHALPLRVALLAARMVPNH